MTTLHFGLIGEDFEARLMPSQRTGFISEGDSFFEWGGGNFAEPIDETVHVYVQLAGAPSADELRRIIPEMRQRLLDNMTLPKGARLIDYVVATDTDDWSENSRVWLLDGSLN